ncbi:MAG: DUF2306 domain-containing protein [Hyphomicrobium sp.]|nr:DUF2306 domain-containing protein [Hyphomicrobium sp.]
MIDKTAALKATRAAPRVRRIVVVLILTLLIIPVGIVAVGSGTGLIPLPYEMFVLAERMPFVFRAHMVTSAIALLLIPAVIMVRHNPQRHRMLGRVVGAFVVAGGLTALPVAIFSDSSLAARAGFFVQGLVWMALFARGILAIRRGDRRAHVLFMVAMFAVTTGAVWFRVAIGTAIFFHLPFAPIYAAAAWFGWLIPLALVLTMPALHSHLALGPLMIGSRALPSPRHA